MNRIFHIIPILLTSLLLLNQCGRKGENAVSWRSISPEVDSINCQLEASFEGLEPDSVKERQIERLCSIAENHPDNICLQSRMHYWKARHYNRQFQNKEAEKEITLAKKFCDSTESPYDAARIDHEITNASEDIASVYSTAIRLLDYFTEIKDSVMMASVSQSLGLVFRNMKDTVNYRRYLRQADDLYRLTGHHKARIICLINSTDLYGKEGADSILNIIRTTPGIEDMQHLYYIALYNSFLYTDRVQYLETLLSLIREDSTQQNGRWHVQSLIALHDFANHGDMDRAMEYSRESHDHLSDSLPLVMQSKIREAYAHNLLRNGDTDSAMRLLGEAHDIYIRYLDAHRAGDMIAKEAASQVRKEKEMYEKMHKLDQTRHYLIAGGIFLGAVIILVNLYILLRNLRLKKRRLEKELTTNRKQLAASQLVTSTKSQIIESMMASVERMKSDGTMSAVDANRLLASLRVHASAKEELESFQKIHETLHPRFATVLGERCPGIPERMIRLASYIAMGYSTQQIADMLSISHGSVNKNRYRLRMKLGLERNESLEHCLRTLCPDEDE